MFSTLFWFSLSRCAVLSSATISGRLSSKVLITQIRWSSPREHWSAFWCKSVCIPNCWSIRLFFASESFPHREIFSLTVPSNTSGCAGRKDSWLCIAESSSSSSFLPDQGYFYNNRQWPYQRSSRQDSHNSQTSVPNATEGAKNAAQVFPANRNEPARWSQSLLCCTDGLSHISQPERGSEKKQSLQPGHFKIDCSIYNFRNKKGKAHFQSNRNSRQKHIKHCFSGYCFPDISCIRIFIYFFWIFVNQHCGLSPSQFTKNLPFSLHYSILYYVNLICNLIIDFIMTDYHNQFFFLSFYTLTLSQNFSLFDHPDCCLVHQEETDGHRLKFSQERSSAFLPATGFPVL